MPPLPPDRSNIDTEQRNNDSANLHKLDITECLSLMQAQDRAAVAAMDAAEASMTALITDALPGFVNQGRLVYVGAGTSGRLGVLDASEAPPTFCVDPSKVIGIIAGGDGALRVSSEGKEDEFDGAAEALAALNLNSADTVIGLTAGGTTPYALGALAYAKQLASPPLTALITCSKVDKPEAVDHLIVIPTGAEIITGSTRMKAGTVTKLALNRISTTLMIQSGRVYQNLMVDMKASNDKLKDRAARVITTITGLERAAAFELLDAAGGHAKIAIAMHKLKLDRANAEAKLKEVDGRLDRLIDEA